MYKNHAYTFYNMATKEDALKNLFAEVDAASEVLYGKGLRDVPGRQPGYHGAVASGMRVPTHLKYSGEGGRRSKKGGAACDSRWVRLAVDSAIVLAGAGALVGASYGGFATLRYYMQIYEVGPAVTEIVTALYEVLVQLMTESIPAAAGFAASVATSGMSAASAVISAATKLSKPALPGVAFYRYFVQGESARADAARVFNDISTKAGASKDFAAGVMTRSMAKKAELQASIAATSHQTKEALKGARDTVVQTGFQGLHKVSNLKDIVCRLIDKAARGTIVAINKALAITHILAELRRAGDDVPPAAAAAAAAAVDAAAAPHSPRAPSPRPGARAVHRAPSRSASPHRSPSRSPRGARAAAHRRASPEVDDEASAAMRAFILQGGKHRKRTMHKRSKKHHKKSRKHRN